MKRFHSMSSNEPYPFCPQGMRYLTPEPMNTIPLPEYIKNSISPECMNYIKYQHNIQK